MSISQPIVAYHRRQGKPARPPNLRLNASLIGTSIK